MGFWDTFIKVWQVRTSIKIQESLEESYRLAKKNIELKENIPEIIEQLTQKNSSWNVKMNFHRKKV